MNDSAYKDTLMAVGKTNYLRTCGHACGERSPMSAPVIEKGVIISRAGSVGRRNFKYGKSEIKLGGTDSGKDGY